MPERERFTAERMQSQSGTRVVITGANSGIGFEAAKSLAGKGAQVILAVRNTARGETAAAAIRSVYPAARLEVMQLDLANLDSVRSFAQEMGARFDFVTTLINNAGLMAPPYTKTKDGFELQFGTNHLGHFALTGLMLPQLLESPQSRVVIVSSTAHRRARIDFSNLDGSRGYRRWAFYGQSKLANLLFMRELDRRLRKASAETIAVACHPGFASTQLVTKGMGRFLSLFATPFAQSAAMGALPTLYAATEPVAGGTYIGPTGRSGMRGYPGPSESTPESKDMRVARHLWEVSERLTSVRFDFLPE